MEGNSCRASDLAYPDDCGVVTRYREIVTEPVILLILMTVVRYRMERNDYRPVVWIIVMNADFL